MKDFEKQPTQENGEKYRYVYRDNSQNGKVVFECIAEGILDADEEYKKYTGSNPAKQGYVGCQILTLNDRDICHKKNKEELWREGLEKVAKYKDTLDQEIDPEIIETVVALHLLGLPTSGSCEGHLDRVRHNPWVDVEALGQPTTYKNQELIRQQIIEKYKLTDTKIGKNELAAKEYVDLITRQGYTEEYKEWIKKNEPFRIRLLSLTEEFNSNRTDDKQIGLWIENIFGIAGRVIAGSIEDKQEENKLTLEKLLNARQQIMKEFTTFLKKKYFEDK